MASFIYNSLREDIGKGTIKLDSDAFKVMLLANTYTPSADHETPAQISAHEIPGVGGYTAGGATLQNRVWQRNGAQVKFDADDVEWQAASFTARYAALYSSTASRLCCLFDFGSDKTAEDQSFIIRWHADGIMVLS